MRKSETRSGGRNSAPRAARPGTRVWTLMALLFLAGFAAAVVLRFENERRTVAQLHESQQQLAATTLARSLDARLAPIAGRLEAAARTGRLELAGREGLSAAVLIGPGGASLAQWGDGAAVATAMLASARSGAAWTGIQGDPASIVIARRDAGVLAIGVVDTAALLDPLRGGPVERFALADEAGRLVTSGGIGGSTLAEALSVQPPSDPMAIQSVQGKLADATPVDLAGVPTATPGLRVLAISDSPHAFTALRDVLGLYVLLAAAPLFAIFGVMTVSRFHARRAEAAEIRLEETQARFALAVDGARCGVWDFDHDSDVLDLTELAGSILQMESRRVRLADVLKQLPAAEQSRVRDAFSKARLTGGLIETLQIGAEPRARWVELRGFGIQEGTGASAHRLVGTVVDVTEHREAERRVAALERRLREAIDGFTGPFALWDRHGRILLWNRSFAHLFGLERKSLHAGARYTDVWAAANAAIRTRGPSEVEPGRLREIALKSGQWLQIEERRTADGGLVTVGAEITALKQSEARLATSQAALREKVTTLQRQEAEKQAMNRTLELAKQRAEDANRAKDQFLANMSHELRTPLNAILGFSEIMMDEIFGPLGDERYLTYVRDIHFSGQGLLEQINQILDLSKIEAGKMVISKGETDVAGVVESVLRLLKLQAAKYDVSFRVDAPAELPLIEADPTRLGQMVRNLATNACKFSHPGSEVVVRLEHVGADVRISVIDTGVGIPPEALSRIGQRFEQAETEHARPELGTGLGLAITREFAAMHGGTIAIESTLGKGTTVSITLPIDDVATPLPPHRLSHPEEDAPPQAAE